MTKIPRFDRTKLYDILIKEHKGTKVLYKNSLEGCILNRWVKSWVEE